MENEKVNRHFLFLAVRLKLNDKGRKTEPKNEIILLIKIFSFTEEELCAIH